jgi:hypothetical protein
MIAADHLRQNGKKVCHDAGLLAGVLGSDADDQWSTSWLAKHARWASQAFARAACCRSLLHSTQASMPLPPSTAFLR